MTTKWPVKFEEGERRRANSAEEPRYIAAPTNEIGLNRSLAARYPDFSSPSLFSPLQSLWLAVDGSSAKVVVQRAEGEARRIVCARRASLFPAPPQYPMRR